MACEHPANALAAAAPHDSAGQYARDAARIGVSFSSQEEQSSTIDLR